MARRVGGLPLLKTAMKIPWAQWLAAAVFVRALSANADSGAWTNLAGGDWGDAANWGSGVIADGDGNTADFSTIDLTTDVRVCLDSARTVAHLVFGDADAVSPGGWRLDACGGADNSLTLSGGSPTITVSAQGPDLTATIGIALAGTAGVIKSGEGTLVLGTPMRYRGQTTVNQGTLALRGGSQTLAIDQPLQLNGGGLLDLVASHQYVGSLSSSTTNAGSGGTLTGAGGILTVNQGTTATFAGSMAGRAGLVKAGSRTLVLAGPHTSTGTVEVSGWLSSLRERNDANDLGYGLTLRDGASLSNVASIVVRSATLNLDNTGTRDMTNRIQDAAPIDLDNGTIRYVGRLQTASSERIGAVTASGFCSITLLVAGNAQTQPGTHSAELTLSSLTRRRGAMVQFNRGGGVNTPLGRTGNNPRVFLRETNGLTFANGAIVGLSSYNDNDKYYPVGYVAGLGFGNLGQPGFPNNYMPGADGNGFSGANTLTNATAGTDFITAGAQRVRAGGQTINSLGIQGSGTGNGSGFSNVPVTFADTNDTLTLASGWLAMWFQQTSIGTRGVRGAITSGQGELFLLGGYQAPWGDAGNVNTMNCVVKDNGTNSVTFVMNLGRHTYLTAPNTYSGGTVVNGMLAREAGTRFRNNLYLDGSQDAVVIPNAADPAEGLILTGANVRMLNYGGQIGSSNIVTLNGGSTLTLTNDNTLAGLVLNSNAGTAPPVVRPSGTLTVTGDIVSIPGNLTLVPAVSGGALDLAGSSGHRIAVAAAPGGGGSNDSSIGLTISSEIRNGGFIKDGAGVLELTGANTYAGRTVVREGTLRVTQPYFGEKSDVYLSSGARMDLAFDGVNEIRMLFVDGVPQPRGRTYGRDGALSAFFTGQGLLRVPLDGLRLIVL